MGLAIGVGGRGFIEEIRSENEIADSIANRCRRCGRDKRKNAIRTELPTTNVLERCYECQAPMVWEKLNSKGERETWIWHVESQKPVIKKERRRYKSRREVKISF